MAGARFRTKDLQPGDVLLYRATDSLKNTISKLIRKLDVSEVSHAGIYLGGGQIAEALIVGNPGVHANPVATSIAGCDWVEVRRLPGRRNNLQPVMDAAGSILTVGERYAYEQILLLAVLLLTRKVDLGNGLLRTIITTAMNKANRWLSAMLAHGREPMICSEFVYRCYDQADERDDDLYTLEIGGTVPAASQSRFSSRKRHNVQTPTAAASVSTIHPESLMARLADNPPRIAMQAATPAAAPDAAAGRPDPALDLLIESYLATDKAPMAAMAASAEAVAPDVNDVENKAAEFSQLLAVAKTPFQVASMANAPAAAMAAAVVRTIADFVTPADLLRTASLGTVGRLTPGS